MADVEGEARIKWGPLEINIKSTKPAEGKFCHKCEKVVFPEASYCPYCGEKLDGQQ